VSCAIWKHLEPGTALFTADFVVDVRRALHYLCGMAQTLERRVEELEHKLADPTTQFADVKSRQKDWPRTFGLSRGDDGFKEMLSLGRAYRQSLRHQGNGAGSRLPSGARPAHRELARLNPSLDWARLPNQPALAHSPLVSQAAR
jgi:hypothetical protein